MADFHQVLIFSWNASILDSIYMGMGGKGMGWGGWWQRLKQRSKTTQIVECRVAMMFICTHNGPIFHYKAKTDVY